MKIVAEETRDPVVPGPPSSSFVGKRVAAVVYSTYPADPRPRRAAEALAKEGAIVEVICLSESDEVPRRQFFSGVDITRVPIKRIRGGKFSYVLRYGLFILFAGAILARRGCKRRYDLVHVHNMPDVLVVSALLPKILGAKVILDLHDPMPELMMTIFGLQEQSYFVRLLKKLEKWSLRFADAVITVNEAFKKVFSTRSCASEKLNVVMNAPDEAIFRYHPPSKPDVAGREASRPFVIMYHGTLVERQGLDSAVIAFEKIKKTIPGAKLRIFGERTPFLDHVMNLVQKLELGDSVEFLGPKRLEEIPEAIRECDVGIIPNRRSKFAELNTPTRIFEFLSQGKPVIAPRGQGVLDYFAPQELVLFRMGDVEDLAAKMEYVFYNPEEMVRMVERAQEVYLAHRWRSERQRFLDVVSRVLKVSVICLLLIGAGPLARTSQAELRVALRIHCHHLFTTGIRSVGRREAKGEEQLLSAT
jgi:glycosyltransferase involved in cell wall biosynthesis